MSATKIIGGEFKIPADILNMGDIGGYEPVYSLGRTCFCAILEQIRTKVRGGVLLPDYLCGSVAKVPPQLNIPFKHYHIGSDFCQIWMK